MSVLTRVPRVEVPPRPWRLTHEEYHRLGESGFFRGKRVQLIRGEVVEMSPMGGRHAMGISLAAQALGAVFAAGYVLRVQLPLKFLGSEPEPDAAVVPGQIRDYLDHPSSALLVVEVADATLDYDLSVKAELYAEAGILDYWVVDLDARVLHVPRAPRPVAAGGHRYYDVRRLSDADSIAPLAAPHALVKVADLLP